MKLKKSASILRKFLLFNLVTFSFLGLFTLIYLGAIQPNLVKKIASNHATIINNTSDHLERLGIEYNNEEIKKFCKVNFNVNFPMTDKVNVKGDNAHPIYLWAKKNHGKSAVPKWNFHKILINKEGKIHDTYSSFTKPNSKKITQAIEEVLDIK